MKNIIIVFTIFFISSCTFIGGSKNKVVDDEKFIDVLVDMHFADAVLSIKGFSIKKDSATINMYYDDILKKHNISRKQFDKTLEYYSKNATEYDKIYEQVLEKLKIMSSENKEKNEKLNKERPERIE